MKNEIFKYFMASHTPEGFFSVYDNIYSPNEHWHCYILKGGPGTGKSTLMKKIAETSKNKNIPCEIAYCSSDPDSIDAVRFPTLKKCVVDGTPPHVMEPKFPGICENIVNLGTCWNEKKLEKYRDELINLYYKNSEYHKKASTYLNAYRYIESYNTNIIKTAINYNKLEKFCTRLLKKLFNKKIISSKSSNFNCMINAITPKGYTTFAGESIIESIHDVFEINDNFCEEISNIILTKIQKYSLSKGYSVITSVSPLAPKSRIDAIILPEMNTALYTKNLYMNIKSATKNTNLQKINAKRFIDLEIIRKNKNIFKFNQKICKEFLNESTKNLKLALKTHNEIEKIYINSMNYSKTRKIANNLISAIFNY